MKSESKLTQAFLGSLSQRVRRFFVIAVVLDVVILALSLLILYIVSSPSVPKSEIIRRFLVFPILDPVNDGGTLESLYVQFSVYGLDPFLLSVMNASYIPLIVILFVIVLRLLSSVGFLPFLPSRRLDERQIVTRDRIFQLSFWFLCLMGLLFSGFQMYLSFLAKQEGSVEGYSIHQDGSIEYFLNSANSGTGQWVQLATFSNYLDLSILIFRILLIACLVLPILVTAWTEPDSIEKEFSIGESASYVS